MSGVWKHKNCPRCGKKIEALSHDSEGAEILASSRLEAHMRECIKDQERKTRRDNERAAKPSTSATKRGGAGGIGCLAILGLSLLTPFGRECWSGFWEGSTPPTTSAASPEPRLSGSSQAPSKKRGVTARSSMCGSPDARHREPTPLGWNNYSCLDRTDAGSRWSKCILASAYADTPDQGCPGATRCCPPESKGTAPP